MDYYSITKNINTIIFILTFLTTINGLITFQSCPALPKMGTLDSIDQAIPDTDAKLNVELLTNGTWYEIFRDESYAHGLDCFEFNFELLGYNQEE